MKFKDNGPIASKSNPNPKYKLDNTSVNTKNISLNLGDILFKPKKNIKTTLTHEYLDITNLDLPEELVNNYLVNNFIKKLLLIPEKDLITILTNFKNNAGETNVGSVFILKELDENFNQIYKGIFGYYNVTPPPPTPPSTLPSNIPVFAYSGYDPDNLETTFQYLADEYPNVLFIFNDNFTENYDGTGGNAIIRGKPNAYGIPTGAYKSDNAFVDNDSLYNNNTNTNTLSLNTKVLRKNCTDDKTNCQTIQQILEEKLENIKYLTKHNFKAIVYSSEANDHKIATSLFKDKNGTSDEIIRFITDNVIKKISNYTHGISKSASVVNLKQELDKIADTKTLNQNALLTLSFNKNPNNENTLKLIKYKNKHTAVSTRFYQLKMKQLLILIADRILYFLNENYHNKTDIYEYLEDIRNTIKDNTNKLEKYLSKHTDNQINSRSKLKKITTKFDIKNHATDFYTLTRNLIKLVNEENKIKNLVYIITTILNYYNNNI